MNLATIRDAGQREARAERDQLAATGEPEAAWEPGGPSREEIAEKYREWIEEERAKGHGAAAGCGLSGARLVDTPTGEVTDGIPAPAGARGALAIVPPLYQLDLPGPRATTLAEFRGAATPRISALRERGLRDIAPARDLAGLLKAARRWLRPRERRTPPTAFRMAFMLPETPSLAEMTIIETPFRIPRYMDHPAWRPS